MFDDSKWNLFASFLIFISELCGGGVRGGSFLATENYVNFISPSFFGVNLKKQSFGGHGGVLSLLLTDYIDRADLIDLVFYVPNEFRSQDGDREWRDLYELFSREYSFVSFGSNIVLYFLEDRSDSVYCLLLKLDRG